MRLDKKDMVLYAVTDRHWLNGESLYSQVEKALKGGATFIQLREKNLGEEEFLAEAKEIAREYRWYWYLSRCAICICLQRLQMKKM